MAIIWILRMDSGMMAATSSASHNSDFARTDFVRFRRLGAETGGSWSRPTISTMLRRPNGLRRTGMGANGAGLGGVESGITGHPGKGHYGNPSPIFSIPEEKSLLYIEITRPILYVQADTCK